MDTSHTSDSVNLRNVVRFADDNDLYDCIDRDGIITNNNGILDIYHEAMGSPYFERKDIYSAYSKADFYRAVYTDETETMSNDDDDVENSAFKRNLLLIVGGNLVVLVASKLIFETHSCMKKTSDNDWGG